MTRRKDDYVKQLPLGGEARELEEQGRRLAQLLRGTLPPHLGFTLFVFDQGFDRGTDGGDARVSYISTADREEMVSVIRDWLARASP